MVRNSIGMEVGPPNPCPSWEREATQCIKPTNLPTHKNTRELATIALMPSFRYKSKLWFNIRRKWAAAIGEKKNDIEKDPFFCGGSVFFRRASCGTGI